MRVRVWLCVAAYFVVTACSLGCVAVAQTAPTQLEAEADAQSESAAKDVASDGSAADTISLPAMEVATTQKPRRAARVAKPGAAPGGASPTAAIDRQGDDGAAQGYSAESTASGLKFDAKLKDVPQTVVVVPRRVLEDAGAKDVGAALDSVAGVSRGNAFGGLNLYEFNFRGMATRKWAKNGISAGRNYDSAADTANVERVDVLLGAANALYGRSDPGGFYNVITKQPQDEPFFATTGMLGSFNFHRATIDANYAIPEVSSARARFNMAVESGGSFREHVSNDRLFFAPAVLWRPDANTRITLEGEFVDEARTFDRGGVSADRVVRVTDLTRYFGEPNDGRIDIANASGMLRVEHDLGRDFTLRFNIAARSGQLFGWTAEPTALLADGYTLTRTHQLRDFDWESLTTQIEAVGRAAVAGFQHRFLIGVEAENFRGTEILNRSNPAVEPYSIDIRNPVYGQGKPAITRFSNKIDSTDSYSLYLSDQVEISSRFKALVGLRWESHNQVMTQRVTGEELSQSPAVLIPRIGFNYDIFPGLALFANYSESFRPNLDADTGFIAGTGGAVFKPERGVSYEAGVKFDIFDDKLSVSAAAFEITKENVLTPDPGNPGFSIAAGEVGSRGFDINVSGSITRELSVLGGYAYIDARVTDDPLIPVGSLLANVPRHSFKLRGLYEFQDGLWKGLGVGGQVSIVGDRASTSTGAGPMLPGYTTIDLLACYELADGAKLSLNIDNVLGEKYVESAFGPLRLNYGAPTSALLTLGARF